MAFAPPGLFLLAGGLDADNLRERAALCPSEARIHLQGFDAASRLERSPGIKDPLKVRTFIQTAKSMTAEAFHAHH
jgi:phosphoribosylanthranilate isomerase